jgi:hypothetical protein
MGAFRGAKILAIWDARISDLRDGESVTVRCLHPSCRHEAIIPVETIKKALDREGSWRKRLRDPVDHLPRYFYCTVCGERRAEVDVGRALGHNGARPLLPR